MLIVGMVLAVLFILLKASYLQSWRAVDNRGLSPIIHEFDGTGEPELGTGIKPTGLNWTPACRHPDNKKADRPQREPARDWSRSNGNHGSVNNPLDTERHQRSSGTAKAVRAMAASPPIA